MSKKLLINFNVVRCEKCERRASLLKTLMFFLTFRFNCGNCGTKYALNRVTAAFLAAPGIIILGITRTVFPDTFSVTVFIIVLITGLIAPYFLREAD